MSLRGAADGDAFCAYVDEVLAPTLRPGNVVIMDNLSVHKLVGVRQAIENAGARLVFLPPYHPDLNPIEKLWSKMKTIMRGLQARTIDLFHNLSNRLCERSEAIQNCCGIWVDCFSAKALRNDEKVGL